jgi:hypothetical protein
MKFILGRAVQKSSDCDQPGWRRSAGTFAHGAFFDLLFLDGLLLVAFASAGAARANEAGDRICRAATS